METRAGVVVLLDYVGVSGGVLVGVEEGGKGGKGDARGDGGGGGGGVKWQGEGVGAEGGEVFGEGEGGVGFVYGVDWL